MGIGRRVIGFVRKPMVRRAAAGAFSVGVFVLALVVLSRTVGRFDLSEVTATARAYPPRILVGALLFALGSYGMLSGFDWLGLKHIGRRLPAGWTGLVSFVSHAISHNAGFAVLTGGSVRLRMYSAFGLSMTEVAGVIAFAGLSFALGAAGLGAFAFVAEGDKVGRLLGLPPAVVTGLGWLVMAVLIGYMALSASMRQPLRLGQFEFAPPGLFMSVAQMGVAAADLALVAGALYLLLPLTDVVTFPTFVGLYVVATLTGTLSHVPGGLGVFEGALVLMLPELNGGAVLAALLVFRVFYNLLPLLLAAIILAGFELVHRRRHVADPEWIRALGPAVASMVAFGAGTVLLVTGAISPPSQMPRWLSEPAHLLSGGVGAALIGLAWGLVRQARWAFFSALSSLAIGAILALLRGPDWITAAILAACFAVVVSAASLFACERDQDSVPLAWLGAGAAVVAGAAWLTWHGDVGGWEQTNRLLSFASADEGARAMRGNLVAAAALAALGAARAPSDKSGARRDERPLRPRPSSRRRAPGEGQT